MFARFDENPAMTLQDIKETKRYGRTDNVKTVFPTTNKVCGGYIYDISDLTLVDMTKDFSFLCTVMVVNLCNFSKWVEPSMNIHEGKG